MDHPLATLPDPGELRERLDGVTLRDEHRLRRRIDALRSVRNEQTRLAKLERLTADVARAELRLEQRRAAVPLVRYPPDLPVSQRRVDLLDAIRDSQVVVVAGETGSGKTTQLPKICLELGRGVRGLIGHTQPRRLAARTVAERIAEELGATLGDAVGYKVRFTDRGGEDTLIKLMTDGILLAELQNDRMLWQYDTLILDEAHERSLNIDFLLGYLKQLLPRRPDLKVVITSATIDPERFSRHFDDAPIVEVTGRTYPVEVRYQPLVEDVGPAEEDESDDPDDARSGPRDQTDAICEAVEELCLEGPGDILVFLSGEREIRDTADALAKTDFRKLGGLEILPLYARLSAAEQHRVFQPHHGRRVVLATNVAETSLTVPGIRYVVDPGTARISRYSFRLKVQRLPIEAISQASANQRKGRCGRLAAGICIRLYSEGDFLSRPAFTAPEILRTNLASVILQMTALGLGDIAAFPFVDPPDRRQVKDGLALLHELGAIDPNEAEPRRRLTPVGRQLAQLPIDPRLARMVVEAERNGAVHDVLVIAAALSIQDPRERPVDKQQAAAEKHARFTDPESDFLTFVNLWNYLREQQRKLSSNQFRRLCKAEFLHYLRIREWQDLHGQLRQVAKGMGIVAGDAQPSLQQVHQSLLAGLLSHVGLKDAEKQDYLGARGARFAIFPGSALFKKRPRWVMAAELVETSRLWGRMAGRIEPEWVEAQAGHLVKRTYSEPHWEKDRAAVMAYERVTLFGVPLAAQRKVGYGRVDAELSRELFIRHALVEGDWRTHHAFFDENRALLEEAEELEHRARRRDIVVDDETLFAFYDERIPADVVSGRHFDAWWKKERRRNATLLHFTPTMLVAESADAPSAVDYPDVWQQGDLTLPLSYQFEPGADADGVTVHIPLTVLNQVRPEGFDWQIPGLREALVTALIRCLPKAIRTSFVPAPDTARAALREMTPSQAPVIDSLARALRSITGVVVPPDAWDLDRVPPHLRVTFRVEDEKGRPVGEGKDLDALKEQLAVPMQRAVSAALGGTGRRAPSEHRDALERSGERTWTFGTLPRSVERDRGGHAVKGYPALVDEGTSVGVRVLATPPEQSRAMWSGTRRLVLLTVPSPVRYVHAHLGNAAKLALAANPHHNVSDLLEDCVTCAVDHLLVAAGGPAWDADGFDRLLASVRAGLPRTTLDVVRRVEQVLVEASAVERRLRATTSLALLPALTDIRAQLSKLVYRGFVTATGSERLPDLVRYLRAVDRRLEKLPDNVARDRERQWQVEQLEDAYDDLVRGLGAERAADDDVRQIRWRIEELRVSLFAQTVGTPYPVSPQRITRAIQQARSAG